MRQRILERWLRHHGFRYAEGVARLIETDATADELAARLFIQQAEARHATAMFRDKILLPLLDLKAAN